jgi:predicted  nucleic acid-binding Zn-ribbon protein
VSQTAALYHLQTLDTQRDAAQARIAEIEKLLNQNEAVKSAQTALDTAKINYLKWRTSTTNLELERSQLGDEADAAEQRLYSGKVGNPREMTDLQDKITSLRHRWDSLEEPLLEAMMELEQGEVDMHAADSDLKQVLDDQAHTLGALNAEQNQLTSQVEQLDSEIEMARRAVQPQSLALYDQLRKRPGGIAVARMEDESCTSCGVELTSQLAQQVKHGQVIPCPTCGRILFA